MTFVRLLRLLRHRVHSNWRHDSVIGTDVRVERFWSISWIASRAAATRPDSAPIRVSKVDYECVFRYGS